MMSRYALVGFPDEGTKKSVAPSGSVRVSVAPTFVYLESIAEPPEMAKPFPRFYGKLTDRLRNEHTGASLDDMAGFSGGPILGFKTNSAGQPEKYFLVAMQSGWRRDLRVVTGPLISVLAADLTADLYRAMREPPPAG